MDVIMDGLLLAASLFAALYCWVLSRRVRALQSLDAGLGGAIVTLTRQIELARATLEEAKSGARETRQDLAELTARADAAAAQLRLLLAAVERAPAPARAPIPVEPPAVRRQEPAGPRLAPDPAPDALREAAPEPGREPGREPVQDRARAPRAAGPEEDPASVPKPRRALSIGGLMRRRAPAGEADPVDEDVVAALAALAGGDR